MWLRPSIWCRWVGETTALRSHAREGITMDVWKLSAIEQTKAAEAVAAAAAPVGPAW